MKYGINRKYKVKRVVVYPGKSMKLHKHEHRMESWTIAEGFSRDLQSEILKKNILLMIQSVFL